MFLVLRATKQLYPSIHHQLLHRQTFILKQRRRRREWWWSSLIQHPFLSRISKQPLFTFAVTASPPLPPHPHVRCVGVFLYKWKFLALPDCTGDHLLHIYWRTCQQQPPKAIWRFYCCCCWCYCWYYFWPLTTTTTLEEKISTHLQS